MFIERGDGTRVRIPNNVEAQGTEAIAAFLAKPPEEAIVPALSEPIPGEVRAEDRQVHELARLHKISLAGVSPTGPAGHYRRQDIADRLPQGPTETAGAAASADPGTSSTRRGGRGAPTTKES